MLNVRMCRNMTINNHGGTKLDRVGGEEYTVGQGKNVTPKTWEM